VRWLSCSLTLARQWHEPILRILRFRPACSLRLYDQHYSVDQFEQGLQRSHPIIVEFSNEFGGSFLSKLILLSSTSEMDRHVVFVHGLRRPNSTVWMSSGAVPESWPLWLVRSLVVDGTKQGLSVALD